MSYSFTPQQQLNYDVEQLKGEVDQYSGDIHELKKEVETLNNDSDRYENAFVVVMELLSSMSLPDDSKASLESLKELFYSKKS